MRATSLLTRSLGVCTLLSVGDACSSAPDATTGPVIDFPTATPATADVQAFSRLTNLIPTNAVVGGSSGWVYVDTGNPWALLDPTTFPSAAANGGTLPSIAMGGVTASNPFAYGSATGDITGDSTFNVYGNVGCTVVCGFTPSFNFRDATLTLGNVSPPSGLEPAVVTSFSLEGGGTEGGVAVPRSRIVVNVSVEGKSYAMIVDTGASEVTLSEAAFSALTSDGRVQLSSGSAETTSGTSSVSLTRAASVVLGGVDVDSVVVAHDSSFDQNLAAVSTDVGQTIDGSLGGTFLHDFYVTVDYSAETISLARYEDTSFALDPGEHLGLDLEIDESGNYFVAQATGDAATKGVRAGDAILSIDGQTLSSLTTLEASVLLFGAVGASKVVAFGAAENVAFSSVAILVDETLPLP